MILNSSYILHNSKESSYGIINKDDHWLWIVSKNFTESRGNLFPLMNTWRTIESRREYDLSTTSNGFSLTSLDYVRNNFSTLNIYYDTSVLLNQLRFNKLSRGPVQNDKYIFMISTSSNFLKSNLKSNWFIKDKIVFNIPVLNTT